MCPVEGLLHQACSCGRGADQQPACDWRLKLLPCKMAAVLHVAGWTSYPCPCVCLCVPVAVSACEKWLCGLSKAPPDEHSTSTPGTCGYTPQELCIECCKGCKSQGGGGWDKRWCVLGTYGSGPINMSMVGKVAWHARACVLTKAGWAPCQLKAPGKVVGKSEASAHGVCVTETKETISQCCLGNWRVRQRGSGHCLPPLLHVVECHPITWPHSTSLAGDSRQLHQVLVRVSPDLVTGGGWHCHRGSIH